MRIAYIRVSTVEQNLDRQREALEKYDIEKWYEEKVSAKDTNRPQLQTMLDFVREGDTVYVHDFSRLARSTRDLLGIVDLLSEKKVHLVSVKESLDTSTPNGRLMLTMLAAINEFERQNMLERQREGIAIAKRNGAYKGRKRIDIPEEKIVELYRRYMAREISLAKAAKEVGVSRPVIGYRFREYKEKLGKK